MGRKISKPINGFTLLEILVALALISVIVALVVSSTFNSRDNMEEAISNIERAIRFSVGESALRNVITRVQFDLDKDPQELSVEYGPDDSFVLPPSEERIMGVETEGTKESEEFEKRAKKINQSFNKVSEFSEGALKLPGGVSIIAIGTNISLKLITNNFASIYVYPSGEKDGAIVILSSDTEVIGLSISPFKEEFQRTYKEIKMLNESEDIEDIRLNIAKELYEEWLKN
ncbi:MAG: hypothetical protein A2381_11850 [Bdellovibrionales bacterium RIFOXYB1_FULL_37_110]|nr:MAG: hypothetical protein A2181_05915 [Bdellovibrionales bacterium RIFOXYA1_FULL_38_20]OFZ49249.1 MAG: hypothetical protein A2417_17090 [Bdellovibrionales bacterium RIFOXYC1_FULL_37_79]OFZ58497.1 MAG: hypothetical protein A2381_11850 [Bdellovibrionales bacterium RIFOXYB1_FULL_37_110]OFZ61510.1 MAG: hypothetical protein A2577_00370 [Bdellovibrionales bacterium RIFOXYD1_FULL_36_51]